MARRGGPVLLEIVQRGMNAPAEKPRPEPKPRAARSWRFPKRERAPRPARPVRAPDDGAQGEWWASLPRIVRLPIGYVFVAGAAVLALVIAGYLVGYKRAEATLTAQQREIAARGLESAVEDPLLVTTPLNPGLLAGGSQPTGTNQPTQQTRQQQSAPAPTQQRAPAASAGGDTRVAGHNYFIVMRDTPQEADRAIEFLRDNGVEAIIVASPRSSLRQVVALRGFAPGEVNSPEARGYKASLQSLGRLWRRDHRGSTDWSDCYPEKYNPGG